MKAILMSIKPKYGDLIDKGEKTVEVRKSFPSFRNVITPFTVYLYCSRGDEKLIEIIRDGDDLYGETYHGKPVFITIPKDGYGQRFLRGTVFGEFTCDCAEVLNELFVEGYSSIYHLPYNGESCLTIQDLENYGHGKRLWGWHISDYRLYRTPKHLEDFGLKRPPQSWCYVDQQAEMEEHEYIRRFTKGIWK